MFELLFGGIFLGVSLLFTVIIFFGGISAGGIDIIAVLFMVPFWIIGAMTFFVGINKVKKNKETEKKGQQSYGIVVGFSESGCYVNGCPVWDAHIAVVTNYRIQQFVERAGINPKYDVGQYVSVKYYNDDINVLEQLSAYSVPDNIKSMLAQYVPLDTNEPEKPKLQQQAQDFIVRGDVIIIDGVEYKRPT